MSRLDKHVAAVQNKLALVRFSVALCWALNFFALGTILTLLVVRVFDLPIPHAKPIFWGALGLSVLGAIVWAMVMRPSAKLAAVAIDEKLRLKEKLSTALFMRSSPDEFARLAVKDAEKTAENVALNLGQHFPMRFPRAGYFTLSLAISAFLVAWLMPTMDLFGREESRKQQAQLLAQQKNAEQAVKRVLAAVEQQPRAMQDNEAVKNAKITLEKLLHQGVKDPAQASRTALQAAQEVQEALKKEAMNNAKYAIAQNEAERRKNLMPSPEEKGPVAEAQREMAKGNFSEAIAKLNDVASKFDQMEKKEQEKAAQQMQQLAQQLQQAAQQQQNQQQQQQQQQQLQNMGANQQQAQQMQNLMQQAAQGNQQAQQQLQQMAQQAMQQMNNGQGPNAQQQAQMQQMLAQMQAQANNAAAAQQMAQAAQAMAQAMQGGQGQQQPGQQNMQQAMQQMQQQLQDMEAAAADAQQVAAAQQAMQDAADQAAGACNGEGEGEGNGMAGNWKPGDPNRKGGDGKGGGPGQAFGQRSGPEASPFGVKQEISKSKDNAAGKLLAANYIKDNAPLKGEAKESLKEVAVAAERDAADEVDQERVSRQAAKAVKEYFNSLGQEEPTEATK